MLPNNMEADDDSFARICIICLKEIVVPTPEGHIHVDASKTVRPEEQW
jgi:hypothetical protein